MNTTTIRALKQGEYFRMINGDGSEMKQTYIRGDFDKSALRYVCNSVDDVWGNGREFKGDKVVSIGFTY